MAADVTSHPIMVVGGGPAGWASACLLAQEGVDVAIAAPPAKPDARTVALMQPSIQMLKYIGVWPGTLAADCAPLRHLHIIDDTGDLVTAPHLKFSSHELNLPEFGWNVPISLLVKALQARAAALDLTIYNVPVSDLFVDADGATLNFQDGTVLNARAVIGADGLNSLVRTKSGIDVEIQALQQAALVTSFSHSAPHGNVSTEFHKHGGPFTTVPLPGNRSSLVWMDKPEKIAGLATLTDEDLAVEIQLAGHGTLGRISAIGHRSTFPMRIQRARTFAANRVYLVGEAAHGFPPLGAQGLNMSLRDAGHAADVILAASDPGARSATEEFCALRRSDVDARIATVRAMNATLLSDFAPAALARTAGLTALAALRPLRQFALRKGIAASENLPFAMRAAG